MLKFIQITLIMLSFFTAIYSHGIEQEDMQDSTDNSTAGNDGPYIFLNGDKIDVKSIFKYNNAFYCKNETFYIKSSPLFAVNVNDTFSFSFKLRDKLENEQSIYSLPGKIAVLSDIEGNFFALRDFLLNNGIIDNRDKWIFGKGHLVLTGDMFDRGLYVTQLLWYIYKLEQEALAAGGYVHLILGNHEIMNMNIDLRYVRKKYFENCMLMNEEYKYLYTMQSELGRWLNSKNIIEKIGPYLFVHGGISQEFTFTGSGIKLINDKAREYYFNSKGAKNSSDTLAKLIYTGKTSPFWYRGFIDETADEKNIDSILNTFGSEKIIVGHTIVENIRYFYNKKIIGVDTDHAEGDTEGIIIEEGKIFRADKFGNKSELN